MTLSQRKRIENELVIARRHEFADHSAFVDDRRLVVRLLRQLAALSPRRTVAKRVQVIDGSEFQGAINFDALRRTGVYGFIAKATEGLTLDDAQFHRNAREAKRVGLLFGAYHFARPQPGRTGAMEADHFLRVVGSNLGPGTMIPWLDIETTRVSRIETIAFVHDFARHVWDSRGWRTGVYTYQDFLTWPPMGLPLWLANYSVKRRPSLGGFPVPVLWQFTPSGRRTGISGAVDLSETETRALAGVTIGRR